MRRALPFLRFHPVPALALAAALVSGPLAAPDAHAQSLRREQRGVWVAAVSNLDFPISKYSTPAQQQAELVTMFDQLKAAGTNVIQFHVRTECDALYRSATEPWSQFLTGTQGKDPGWDPLAFAIEKAHERGMELHAWLNPYRADAAVSSTDDIAPTHVLKEHPEWVLNIPTLPNKKVLDPGIPAVRAYITDVVGEIVTNYDVDGIHFDDYFYPYPEGSFVGMRSEDNATYQTYRPAGMSQAVFRQFSVNMMVRDVQARINSIRPSVRFGISPFGIWRSGTPSGISGMSGADAISADAVTWMEQGWLDYLTPQLYWRFGGGQDYAKLAPWWKTKMTPTVTTVPMPTTPRHLYPGLITSTNEVGRQIDSNRVAYNIPGQTIFRARTLLSNTNFYLGTRYAKPALPLVMPWKGDTTPPDAPTWVGQSGAPGSLTVSWAAPAPAADGDRARWYAIQRVPLGQAIDLASGDQLVGLVGGAVTTWTYTGPAAAGDRFVVLAYDENWNESAPSPSSFPVAGDAIPSDAALALAAAPSPAREAVTLRYRLPAADVAGATLDVYDTLGRRVARLAVDGGPEGEVVWAVADVPPGVYVARLSAAGASAAQRVVVAR